MHDEVDITPIVKRIQEIPYSWPSPPDAASVKATGVGTCASKHALLAEELLAAGIESLPLLVVGPLVPRILADDPEMEPGRFLPEVHECLTVLTHRAGPLRVDVTWDPPLIDRGLPGTLNWDGHNDMSIAIGEGGPCWAVPRDGLREAKEALRNRLYRGNERDIRDRTLAAMSRRFEEWRTS